jgi:hypothetical protein
MKDYGVFYDQPDSKVCQYKIMMDKLRESDPDELARKLFLREMRDLVDRKPVTQTQLDEIRDFGHSIYKNSLNDFEPNSEGKRFIGIIKGIEGNLKSIQKLVNDDEIWTCKNKFDKELWTESRKFQPFEAFNLEGHKKACGKNHNGIHS